MITLPFCCPGCQKVFRGRVAPVPAQVLCPCCGMDVAASEQPRWFLFRRKSKFGPYSWQQLQKLEAAAQILSSDALGCCQRPPETAIVPILTGETLTPQPLPTVEEMLDHFRPDATPRPIGQQWEQACSLDLQDLRILRKLAAGGMGAVYLAQQRSQDRKVALKLMLPQLAGSFCMERFQREARMLARLHHANFVQFLGAGTDNGLPFFAMEYIEGFSTNELVRYFGGKLAVPDALHIILKCAAALSYAHGLNIVHRDIKPKNIMITTLGKVKIADLGLAKPLDEDMSLTATGLMLGSPKYMAPEQARDAKRADFRSDIYALGGVLYFFLTGKTPFAGSTTMDLLLAKEQGIFPSARHGNPHVPERLSLIIDKMLARDPLHRYQSCAQLISDLERLQLAGEHLSFNPLRVAASADCQGEGQRGDAVEILLIHEDLQDLVLVQQALEEKGIASNLNLAQDGRDAAAFLRRQGQHSSATAPDLIILASSLKSPGILDVLREIFAAENLRPIPVVVLAHSDDTTTILEALQLPVSLTVTKPEDLRHFEDLVQSIQGICLTVVESPTARMARR